MRRFLTALTVGALLLAVPTAAQARPHRATVYEQEFVYSTPDGTPDGVVVVIFPDPVRVRRVTIAAEGQLIDNWVVAKDDPGPFDPDNPFEPTVGVLDRDASLVGADTLITRHYDPNIALGTGDYLVIYADSGQMRVSTFHVKVRYVRA